MKLTTAVILGVGVWAIYELSKNRTMKATSAAMKADITSLKNKVAMLSSDAPSTGTSNGGVTSSASGNMPMNSTNEVAGAGGTSSFVGQPIYQNVYTNPQDSVNGYTGTGYNAIFRKKPTAFQPQNYGWANLNY